MDCARGVAAIVVFCQVCAVVHRTQWFAVIEKRLHCLSCFEYNSSVCNGSCEWGFPNMLRVWSPQQVLQSHPLPNSPPPNARLMKSFRDIRPPKYSDDVPKVELHLGACALETVNFSLKTWPFEQNGAKNGFSKMLSLSFFSELSVLRDLV